MAHRIPATCFAFAEILGMSRKNPRKRTSISLLFNVKKKKDLNFYETYGEQFNRRWLETVTVVVV